MTDITSRQNKSTSLTPGESSTIAPHITSLSDKHENILTLMELFYFAYRDFTGDGDEVLLKIGYGRAHHRVIHFVHHYPGLRVADLLSILKITKQSLARVLKQLIDEDYICQKSGKKDRRERWLYTTEKGATLAKKLSSPQIDRFENAISNFTAEQQETIENFLFSIIQQGNRHDIITLMGQNGHFPTDAETDTLNKTNSNITNNKSE